MKKWGREFNAFSAHSGASSVTSQERLSMGSALGSGIAPTPINAGATQVLQPYSPRSCGASLALTGGTEYIGFPRLNALLDDLHGPLLAHLSTKSEEFRPLMYRIRILGPDEASAKPWVVVLCPTSAVMNVESFFQGDLARSACAGEGVEVAYVGRSLRFKSGLWNEVEVAFATTDLQHRSPWSGSVVLTQTSNELHASMGGVLVVTDTEGMESVVGLTVGHLLHCGNRTGSSPLDVDFEQFISTPVLEDWGRPQTLGRIAEVSFSASARNLDWALIHFSNETTVSDLVSSDPTDEKFILGHCKGSVKFRPDLLSHVVATISNLPARAILPLGDVFINVHPITFSGIDNYELPEGSSGTWVVSEDFVNDTNDAGEDFRCRIVYVHGIVVADDCYGDVYMIPILDIMNDAKQALNATSVTLPRNTREATHLVQSKSFNLHVGSDATISSRTSLGPTESGLERTPNVSVTLTDEPRHLKRWA
ncbi:uncharacterized protein M421DRAFT_88639 [Didymella exigua CBS 183.55]|uniref:Uncharacterized protein n=1 Tax=Didymella exigua CBS 183.55 TaxID=1150837 RepID=A0A6A5S0V8_9PLEO|nr:uncharacterized protein M421DRAFT_88639 [Didymella exigua CBS 183.55]KAF1933419.1 hypothetical protein M421DRAFT_88639 [Didymella exigua CBS 183.55]